ncbi:hypothetical protein CBW65_10765 [Tumebacillus avium]|uniref:Uncharacterized protein n=1 Tax=Tumebacillus avium TaxID=1903704 RepID=A0A1Y0ILN8_9BACL|nr:GerAB/ArcD/ProY family transporter [Tumebacillus avium]ARU61432.1 hypothetical protein CBW65_10765 [Tumebacillus avium]
MDKQSSLTNRPNQIHLLCFVIHLGGIFLMFPEAILVLGTAPWVAVLTVSLIYFLHLWLYVSGLKKFPGQNLIDIFLEKGTWAARLLLLPYALYVLFSIIIVIRAHAEMLTVTMFKQTPIWALSLMLIIVPMYLAGKGIATILRSAMLLSAICLPLLAGSILMTYQNLDYRNLLPLTDFSFSYLHDVRFYSLLFVFSPFLTLGMLNRERALLAGSRRRRLYYGLGVLLCLCSFLAVYIPILTFGPEMSVRVQFSMLIAIDAVDMEWFVFDRITLFYVCAVLGFLILLQAVFFWIATQILSRLFLPRMKKHRLVAGIGVLLFIVTLQIPSWDWVFRLLLWDTPLRLYCMLGIPLLVKVWSLRQGGSA